jgi:hypothetical protein
MKSPSVERLIWVRDELRPWARRFFEQAPQRQSVLLAAAQYWADEADDAVHLSAWTSTERVPDFFSSDWEEEPTGTTSGIDWKQKPRWDDNGSAIRRFQAYCGEGGSQELPTSSQAEPFALLQRDGNGVRLTWLGRCLRPWLDLPHTAPGGFDDAEDEPPPEDDLSAFREGLVLAGAPRDGVALAPSGTGLVLPAQVLTPDDVRCLEAIAKDPFAEGPRRVWADVVLARNDARGAFMQTRDVDLDGFLDHAEFWLGELNQVVPLGSARFEYGSLAAADVFFDGPRSALADSPWWFSVHTLRFSGDEQPFGATMRALRHVSGLSSMGLLALGDFEGAGQLVSLQAEVTAADLELFFALPLRSLQSLSLTLTGGTRLEQVRPPASWSALRELRVSVPWTPTYEWDEDAEAEPPVAMPAVAKLKELNPHLARVAVSSADSVHLPAGYEVALEGDSPAVSLLRLGPSARRELLDAMLEGLPSSASTVRLERSAWFNPTADPFAGHGGGRPSRVFTFR